MFGRADDIEAVVAALRGRGRCALVGPGGVGKSTVARAVADQFESVVFVDAEPIEHIDALLRAVLDALDVAVLPGDRLDDVAETSIAECRALIVVDGVERLATELAARADRWLTAPSGPQLLVTSRVDLGHAVVPVVRLAPLGSTGDAMLRSCVEALGGDVSALTASPERFAALVASTGRLPLAIELVATRIARFGVEFVAAQSLAVDDVIDRSVTRTLDLLDPGDVMLFRRLGVTSGGASIALVAALTGEPIAVATGRAGRLVDHGLIHAAGGRFDMLTPVRDVAMTQLRLAGDDAAALSVALQWALNTFGGADRRDDLSRYRLIRDDIDQCVHLAWTALAAGRRRDALDLVDVMFTTLIDHLRNHDSLALLDAALGSPDATDVEPEREALSAVQAAISASETDTIAHAERWLDRAELAANRAPQPDPLLAHISSIRAFVAMDEGQLALAQQHAARSVEIGERIGNGFVRFQSQRCIATCALALGELDRATTLGEEVLAWGRQHDLYTELHARVLLAWCQLERGERREAAAAARALRHEIGSMDGFVRELGLECELLLFAADPPAASDTAGEHGIDDHAATSSWSIRLEQRLRRAEAFRSGGDEAVVQTATDVGVLAGLVPLARIRIDANLLVASAALALGDRRQALLAAEQALRDAARGPYRLRCADALDALAAVPEGGEPRARGLAAAIRAHCGAVARRSPPANGLVAGAFPSHWSRDACPTTTGIDELVASLRAQLAAAASASTGAGAATTDSLTRAERQIAELVANGLSNNDIAATLFISRRTVETHLTHIFRKLDLRTRTQLAALHLRTARPQP